MFKWLYKIGFFVLLILGIFLFYTFDTETVDEVKPEIVSWEEAVEVLNSGDVEAVYQTHSLEVTLVLKDGSVVKTVEPVIDDIFNEVEKCESCENVVLATE